MWVYDPSSNSWDTLQIPTLPANPLNTYLNMVYDPVHDVCMLQNNGEGWYVFRYKRAGAPEAVFEYAVRLDGALRLDASGSSDPDGRIIRFEWDFNYDWQKFDIEDSGEVVFHGYGSSGVHVVALRVTDNDGKTCILADTGIYVMAVSKFVFPIERQTLDVFPNPFNPVTHIRLSGVYAGKAAIRIFNLEGRLVDSFESGARDIEWNAVTLPSGLYVVQCKTGMKIVQKSVLLTK
jgi:PKD domain/Secretion system C-terminal sorting domain